jgi:hypothetical protein
MYYGCVGRQKDVRRSKSWNIVLRRNLYSTFWTMEEMIISALQESFHINRGKEREESWEFTSSSTQPPLLSPASVSKREQDTTTASEVGVGRTRPAAQAGRGYCSAWAATEQKEGERGGSARGLPRRPARAAPWPRDEHRQGPRAVLRCSLGAPSCAANAWHLEGTPRREGERRRRTAAAAVTRRWPFAGHGTAWGRTRRVAIVGALSASGEKGGDGERRRESGMRIRTSRLYSVDWLRSRCRTSLLEAKGMPMEDKKEQQKPLPTESA